MPILYARLTRHVPAFAIEVKQVAHRQLHGTEPPPHKPTYAYLELLRREEDTLHGIDLLTLKPRSFKCGIDRWNEFDPAGATRLYDIWGWHDLVPLSPEDVDAVVRVREAELKAALLQAQQSWMDYLSATAHHRRPAAPERMSA